MKTQHRQKWVKFKNFIYVCKQNPLQWEIMIRSRGSGFCLALAGKKKKEKKKKKLDWISKFFSLSKSCFTYLCTSSVQSLSCVRLFATPWITARQASLSITSSRSSLRLTSIESVTPSSPLILCHPLLLLPPIPPSISLFQWLNSSHEVAKVLEFQLQHHSLQRTPRTDLL